MRIYKLRHHDICDVIYSPGPIQNTEVRFDVRIYYCYSLNFIFYD